MTKTIALLLSFVFVVFPPAVCLADENRDHVCFRVLDSNRDGVVTFDEFSKVFGTDESKFSQADLDGDGKLTHDEYHGILGHGS